MLIIVESPAKAKTISKIVGSSHVVKASVGHIRGISDTKKSLDGRSLEINGIDIENHFMPIYEIDKGKIEVVKELKKLAKAAKNGVLFATDSDREGEAISWHLAQVLGVKDISKVQRLEFHEITQKAIEEAMAHPRNLNLQLVSAQKARQVLDKLVGFKLSPVLWNTMGNFRLSAGRVQSPALHLICEREKEILNFKPQEYWEINGLFNPKKCDKSKENWIDEYSENDFKLKEGLLRLTKIKGKKLPAIIESKESLINWVDNVSSHTEFNVVSVSEKTEKSSTRPPFITSTLQQFASSKLGFTPKITMQLAQKLYEGVDINGEPTALITYMRTDSVNLSTESVETARKFIQKNYKEFLPDKPKYYKSKSRNAQEAHEAIRPVNPLLTPNELIGKIEPRMIKLYELIWKQMIASQMTDEIRLRVSFDLENSRKDYFSGSVAWTTHLGFKVLTGEEVITKPKSSYQEGEKLYLHETFYSHKFTKPPSRFSPASLIKKMEELGIGRPSTYATIISTLQDREYVENKQNTMFPTVLGVKINDLLSENFTEVTSPVMTANMEEGLDEISRGEKDYEQVLGDFWWDFKNKVETKSEQLKQEKNKYKSSQTNLLCPTCQATMELKIGRFGEYYQCIDHKEHIFAKNFREYEIALAEARSVYNNQTEGKICTECKKNLVVRVSKSSLKPYIACPDYQVGNKHTVIPVNYGPCPKCHKEGRDGVLVLKKGFRSKSFIGCSLSKETCGYIADKK